MTSRSRESTVVTTIECPWCQEPARVGSTALECEACNVTVEIAVEAEDLVLAA